MLATPTAAIDMITFKTETSIFQLVIVPALLVGPVEFSGPPTTFDWPVVVDATGDAVGMEVGFIVGEEVGSGVG